MHVHVSLRSSAVHPIVPPYFAYVTHTFACSQRRLHLPLVMLCVVLLVTISGSFSFGLQHSRPNMTRHECLIVFVGVCAWPVSARG